MVKLSVPIVQKICKFGWLWHNGMDINWLCKLW